MNTNFEPARTDGIRLGGRGGASPRGDELIDLASLLQTLWRGKLFLALTTAIAILLGAWYVYVSATPTYVSSAVVMLNSRQEQVVDLESVVGGLSADTPVVNTEVHVLKSRSLLGKVVDELALVEDPEFNRRLRSPSLTRRVKSWIGAQGEALFGAGAAGPQLSDEARTRRMREATINGLLAVLTVRNLPSSLVFEVRVETTDPERSAEVADTIVRLYILGQIEAKYAATEQATDWLAQRVTELQTQLETAESRVKVFRAETALVDQETLLGIERQVKSLRDRADSTAASLALSEERLARLEEAQTPEDRLAVSEDAQLRRLMPRLSEPSIAETFDALYDQILQRARAEVTRGASQLEALRASQADLETQIDRQSSDLITLQQLVREAEAIRLLYEYFLGRLNETSAQQGIQQADSRALSQAVVPVTPASPNKPLVLAMSALLGLMAGAALLLFREMRVDSFRSADVLERHTGYPVLGQVPLISARQRKGVLAFLVDKPTSAAAEAVRNLRTSLLLSDIDRPPRTIMVSSSVPGEGKTTLSLGLAQNMAAMGKRVLLIEGDIRRRVMDSYLTAENPRKGRGILTVMTGEASLAETVVRHDLAGIDMLLGEASDINAADLLSSDQFAQLLEEAKASYDHVIVDTPPVLVVPDARILARQADCLVLVVGWNRTSKAQVLESLKMFESVNRPVSGFVLNQISPRGMKRYGYGGTYGAYAAYGQKYYTN